MVTKRGNRKERRVIQLEERKRTCMPNNAMPIFSGFGASFSIPSNRSSFFFSTFSTFFSVGPLEAEESSKTTTPLPCCHCRTTATSGVDGDSDDEIEAAAGVGTGSA